MSVVYNELWSVEEAADALSEAATFDQFLASFSATAQTHGVTRIAGAFLLHRHFRLEEGERMCEDHTTTEEGPALVSRRISRDDPKQAPHRWSLDTSDSWVPLEYSSDPAVARHQQQIADFMGPFADLVTQAGLASLIGLALTSRDRLPAVRGQVFFEETTDDCSVVRSVEKTGDEGAFINTLWVPDVTSPQMRCHQWQRCRREGSPPDDRHSYLMGHDRESG